VNLLASTRPVPGRYTKELRLGLGDEGDEMVPVHMRAVSDPLTPGLNYARFWLEDFLQNSVGLEKSPVDDSVAFLPMCYTWELVHQKYAVEVSKVL
jgi:hypothetical protein